MFLFILTNAYEKIKFVKCQTKFLRKFWLFICLKIILIGWVLHCYRDVKML